MLALRLVTLYTLVPQMCTRNSSGDEIANVNFFYHTTSSTTFTQCAPEATEFFEIPATQNKAITLFKVIQGHRFWYQSKAHIRLPICD